MYLRSTLIAALTAERLREAQTARTRAAARRRPEPGATRYPAIGEVRAGSEQGAPALS